MMQTENILNDSRLRALENHTRVNLLRPTLGTTTANGVTCTNNLDGTYTLNGTSTANTYFMLASITLPKGKYNIIDCVFERVSDGVCLLGNIELNEDTLGRVLLYLSNGQVVNNKVYKPMVTDDLSATYDDFVSYGESLAKNKNGIFKQTVIGTTQANGAFSLYLKTNSRLPIGFEILDYSGDDAGGYFMQGANMTNWYLMVKRADGSTIANTTLTVEVYYINRER